MMTAKNARLSYADKDLAIGTVAIELRAYPFTTVMVVTAEDFATYGLEDKKTYQAKRLIRNHPSDSSLSRTWKYIR